MQKIIPLLVCMLMASMLEAQYHPTVTYTKNDGLPVSELLGIFSDSRGVLWMKSSYGLSRFDGNGFLNISEQNGLADNGIGKVFEGPQGRIWVMHGGAFAKSTYKISVLNPAGGVDTIYNLSDLGTSPYYMFQDRVAKTLYLGDKAGDVWTVNPQSGHFTHLAQLEYNGQPILSHPVIDPYRERWFFKERPDQERMDEYILLLRDSSALREINPPPGILPADLIPMGFLSDGGLIFAIRSDESRFARYHETEGWSFLVPQPTVEVRRDCNRPDEPPLLYGINPRGGVARIIEFSACYPEGVEYPYLSYQPFFHNQVTKGKDGSIWIATRAGLVRIFSGFVDFPAEVYDTLVADLHAIGEDSTGRIWFASYNYGMSWFDGRTVRPAPPELESFYRFLPGSHRDTDGAVLFAANSGRGLNGILRLFDFGHFSIELEDLYGYCFHQSYDGELGFGLTKRGLAIRQEAECRGDSCWEIIGPEKGFELTNVITTVKDRRGRWWMGRPSAGIAYYDQVQDTVYNFLREDRTRDLGAMSSLLDSRGNVWFGTNRGLAFFPGQEEIDPATFRPAEAFQFVGRDIIGTDQVNALMQLDSTTLAVGTSHGLALLDLPSFYAGKPLIRFFDETNGYTGNYVEQNAFWVDSQGALWIASDLGAHRFDPRFHAWNQAGLEVRIDSLWAGGQTHTVVPGDGKIVSLRTTDRSVRVHFSTDFDSLLNQATFQYRLTGDSLFSEFSPDGMVSFPHLSPGTYCLEVKARRGGMESGVEEICFSIPRPFYARLWFWLAGLLFLGILIRYYERNLEKQRSEKNKLQVQAIVNQLNPHFINNALQWVQVRVYNDQEAVQVISRLGENIRIVFKNSRQNKAYHPLADELRLVENYLFVQKKRFGEKLEYELPSEEVVQRLGEVDVPLMQLQIHCENAVEHGIRNKEEDESGLVRVCIREEKDYLYVTIEDDGVGRSRAREIGSKGTQQGTKMLASMREIFNRRNVHSLDVRYEDEIFETKEGEKYGTRVHIRIPKKYDYEIE